ncbi:MAG TPA: glycosyltransferase family 39 protein [Syntrophales bacterium]|nr:glycosyltransferase family 39 protein [Syntrophales bacterium]HRT71099.1 glycosyltransferase family 39 protein [Syntrophales bacterium]
MSSSSKKPVVLFLMPLILYVALLPAMPLMEPDEARYSDIPSLMNRTGDYITPRLNHVIYLEKPPLCYWATALAFKVFGENEFSSRLFVALCAWGCILLAYRMGRSFQDEETGLYSAAVLTTFLYHAFLGRVNILDMPLAFFVSLAIWSGYRFFSAAEERKTRLYLLYLASGLAFLAKGLIGVVFPFAVVVLWLVLSRRWRDVLRVFSPVGVVILLGVCLPWVVLAHRANKDFLWFFFVQEHFLRYTTTLQGKEGIFLYYVPVLLLGTLPWTAYLWKVLKEKDVRRSPFFDAGDGPFLIVWGLFIFIFYSFSSSKLIPYIAPVFPPLAVAFGRLFQLYERRNRDQAAGWRRLLYESPVFLQSCAFIAALMAPPFLKGSRLGGAFSVIDPARWWLLVAVPIALQVAVLFLPGLVQRRQGKGWFATAYLLWVLFLGSLVFPASEFLSPYKSAYPVAQAVKKLVPPDREVYQYKISLYGIDFYDHIRTPVVDDFGELGYGIGLLPPEEKARYFLTSDAFYRLCEEKGDIYTVTKYKERLEELRKNVSGVEVLWDNGAYYLLIVNKSRG